MHALEYGHDHGGDELRKLYDKLNLTGRVIRVNQHAVAGGCAYIYEARLLPRTQRNKCIEEEGEKVAVKVIREVGSSANEKSLRRRLIREVRAWSALHHRNVLPLYGFAYGFNPSSLLASLVSPWMPNGTAQKYLEKRSASERIRVLTAVADGLCYLHRHDVVHGDLKGENIMIDMNFEPRIADFGLSKLLDEVTCTLTVTYTGNPFGSVRWTAPELISSPGITYESDIWSFGMTILELFTNAPPYRHLKRDAQVIVAVHRGELPPRPSLSSGMDDILWDLCCDCWNPNPQLRPSSHVMAKRLWGLEIRYKLWTRNKRKAPPSPERRRDCGRELEQEKVEDENDGRLRKSPKLSALVELAGDSLPSPSPGTLIPIQQPVSRRSGTPRTPHTPTSRSASGSRSRIPSISPSSSRSRRSSRNDLTNEFDPRRFMSNVHSDGDIFSTMHRLPSPIRRAQTEPTAFFLDEQALGGEFGDSSALALSTPQQHVHSAFAYPAHAWTTPEVYGIPYNAYDSSLGGYATPPLGYGTPPAAYGTPPTAFATPPTSHVHLYPQYDMYMQQQQQPLLMNGATDLELLQQSEYVGGFDADMIHPSQWTSSDPPYTHAAFLSSLHLLPQNESLSFDAGFGNSAEDRVSGQASPFLLPLPPNEADSFGSGYSSYSPSLLDNGVPSPHALGLVFSENFQYEEPQMGQARVSPMLHNQPLHSSPQPIYQDFHQTPHNAPVHRQPSSGTVDFASLQTGVFSPTLSDVSTPDTKTNSQSSLGLSLFDDTPLISGFGDSFAFESEDEGEEPAEGLALFGGLDVSGDFATTADGGHHSEADHEQTPHGSPRQLRFATPLSRNQLLTPGPDDPRQEQMPPTPRLPTLLPSF